jgi:branched-chain amino acid transport system substrate-binding protein
LLTSEFVGEVNQKGSYPNLFEVSEVLPGAGLARTPEEKDCKMSYPS